MQQKTKRYYEFGPYRLDLNESVLLRENKPVYLKPKVFETLVVLVENRAHILDKETLMKRLWQDTFVEEANLAVNISQLRKALGQGDEGGQFIETVPRRGYRFMAEVREVWTEEAALVVNEYTKSRITIEEKETPDEDSSERIADNGAITVDVKPAKVHVTARSAAGALAGKFIRSKRVVITAGLIITTTFLAFAVYRFMKAPKAPHGERFQKLVIVDLPNTGKSLRAAISPDGRYVAHAMLYEGKQSLVLKQVATASDVELIEPDRVMYYVLAFSPDGQYIYYTRSEYPIKENAEKSLYKIPALGGAPVKVASYISSGFTVSPDGKHIAFVRTGQDESNLITASEDGSEEKIIATRKSASRFHDLAYSPDGKMIACTATSAGKTASAFDLIAVSVDEGAEKLISSGWGQTYGVGWASDGNGLLVAAMRQTRVSQIWYVSHPDGELRNITNDANNYVSLSLAADSGSIASVTMNLSVNSWIVNEDDLASAKRITNGASSYANARWMPDGKILFQSTASGNNDIWIMQADGTGQKQLTAHTAADASPVATPDGRYILFESTRSGSEHIWRMDSDGGNVIQLTRGRKDKFPQCSPDGRWVIYSSFVTQDPTLWKVSMDGGDPVQLTSEYSTCASISPDGKMIACLYKDKGPKSVMRMAILPFEGGKPIKVFDAPDNGISYLQWMKDGRALSFSAARDGAPDIWIQPIDGGPAKQLTNLRESFIQSFDWSPDGRQLVCSRQSLNYKVLLMKDSR